MSPKLNYKISFSICILTFLVLFAPSFNLVMANPSDAKLDLGSINSTDPKKNVFLGNEGAHGGSDIALEFKQAAQSSIDFVGSTLDPKFYILKFLPLATILNKVKIYVSDEDLFVNNGLVNQKSIVVSVPLKNIIYINGQDWNTIADNSIKTALALHELLIFAGLEDTGMYDYSQLYLQEINKSCVGPNCIHQIKYFCMLNKTNDSSKTKSVIAKGEIGFKALGYEFLKLEEKESKIRVEVFYFDSIARKDIFIISYDDNDFVTQTKASFNNESSQPNELYLNWKNKSKKASWDVSCTKTGFK